MFTKLTFVLAVLAVSFFAFIIECAPDTVAFIDAARLVPQVWSAALSYVLEKPLGAMDLNDAWVIAATCGVFLFPVWALAAIGKAEANA